VHINLQVSFNIGILPTNRVGEPGIQGLAVIGMQGIGVNTPNAATVAAATTGLAGDEHMANGSIFCDRHSILNTGLNKQVR
jgi:hypothetical protein